ncbi:TetR/AcrR family transcriptional regulator [Saccharopolyspora sp. HNM0983]|uniref:TetR/AcrR family transcriptional regulator n=2 Tax=Saccharopolyspora montiporae TaxID=2781240 RepID=A0A929B4F0_9PSEU|nr:TetR/AcrR family transcriptional regulator [Saccharopolyspora sp. HNM0983]
MAPEQRREHLVSTALQLYSAHAPEDVSIDDIVGAADVSRALFYRYFANIREVHEAALGTVVDELIGRLGGPAPGDFREQLRAALTEFIGFVQTYADSYTALLRSGSTVATSATEGLVERVREHVVELVCLRCGIEEPTGALLLTLHGWVAVVETTLVRWLQEQGIPRESLESWFADQLLSMVATTAEHDPATAAQTAHLR